MGKAPDIVSTSKTRSRLFLKITPAHNMILEEMTGGWGLVDNGWFLYAIHYRPFPFY